MEEYFSIYSIVVSVFILLLTLNWIQYFRLVGKPRLFHGSAQSTKLVTLCPSLTSTYYPYVFAWGRHVQIIPFIIRGLLDAYFVKVKWEAENVTLDDGEIVILDWAIPKNNLAESGLTASKFDTPIVLIHHGAMCNSKDIPGQCWVEHAHKRGWIACVMNRRGHGKLLTKPKFNFFGSVEDVRAVTRHILLRRPNARMLMIGVSSGSGLMGRFFGEEHNMFKAGVGLCPGYDITNCMGRCTSPYQEFLLSGVKSFFLERNSNLLKDIEGFKECQESKNLQEFLDHSYAMAGYKSKEDYYEHHNPMVVIRDIKNPCLFINSEDDPIAIHKNVEENIAMFEESPASILALTKTGTHCPFYEGIFGRSWVEHATFEFFDSVFELEEQNVLPSQTGNSDNPIASYQKVAGI